MKSKLLSALLLAASLIVCTTHAASVTWSSATNISGDSDVSTSGTLVGALNLGATVSPTVNGVLFTGLVLTGTNVTSGNFNFNNAVPPNGFGSSGSAGSASAPFSNLSASYETLLGSVSGMAFTGVPFTLTMSGLTVGDTYEFEWWLNISTTAGSAHNTTATAGNSVTLDPNTTNLAGGLGQFAIGTFVADSVSQEIVFSPNGPSTSTQAIVNGLQLRRQTSSSSVPDSGTTVAMLGFALAGLVGVRRWLRA